MWIGICFVILVGCMYGIYQCYFRAYKRVKTCFETLIKVVETRDLLLLRILPDVQNKQIKGETVRLIEQCMKCKDSCYNDFIKADVELNKQLKETYSEINKLKNSMDKELFKRVVTLEKNLKIIRREYNEAAEAYNQHLIAHKKICVKWLHWRPLDTYKIPVSEKNEM